MKNCLPVSEKPQVRISLPPVKTHLSARAGIFFKTAFFVKRQNFGLGTAGAWQPLGFCFRGHTRDLHRVCTAILFSVSGPISRIRSFFQMSAPGLVNEYASSPAAAAGPALAPFFSEG